MTTYLGAWVRRLPPGSSGLTPPPARPTEQRCPRCRQTKPAVEFARDHTKTSGISSTCKPCHAARKRELAKRP